MNRAVIPGTFDPVTSGHLDIIFRTASLFEEVVVAVARNPLKGSIGPLFTLDERVGFIAGAVSSASNVTVRLFDSLLVDLAEEVGARVIVKGLRAVSDFEHEFQMAQLNRELDNKVETMFIMAVPEFTYLSSSAVKEIAMHGGDVGGMVPATVAEALAKRLRAGR